nr:hypothetical protein [Tanacetum cinerariifolium]
SNKRSIWTMIVKLSAIAVFGASF